LIQNKVAGQTCKLDSAEADNTIPSVTS